MENCLQNKENTEKLFKKYFENVGSLDHKYVKLKTEES